MTSKVYPRQQIDESGRCCGRKPIAYKRPPHLFCSRCNASFDPKTGKQQSNWAFELVDGGMVYKHPHMEPSA